jgi:hypothetical protein
LKDNVELNASLLKQTILLKIYLKDYLSAAWGTAMLSPLKHRVNVPRIGVFIAYIFLLDVQNSIIETPFPTPSILITHHCRQGEI